MKRYIFTLVAIVLAIAAVAQEFDNFFDGRTLRLDYVFAGNHDNQRIYLEQMSVTPQWAGRKSRLADVPLKGNGQIQLADKETGQVLFVHTFSTLFQEWLATEEATQVSNQTFYMSNMSPQLYNFNSYYWAELEMLIRNWSKSSSFKKLYVCKGGTIREDQRYGGKGYFETVNIKNERVRVAIPKYYFMAILAQTTNNSYQSIGFLLEQHGNYPAVYPALSAMKQHVKSIDELESFTGIDFFCNLNDKLENVVEKSYILDAWTW